MAGLPQRLPARLLSAGFHPAFLVHLPAAPDGERAAGTSSVIDDPAATYAPLPTRHRRDQLRIAADEDAVFDAPSGACVTPS